MPGIAERSAAEGLFLFRRTFDASQKLYAFLSDSADRREADFSTQATGGNVMIKPTIGRRVWYWPSQKQLSEGVLKQIYPDQALDAGVICVHGDRSVNLFVTDHFGRTLFLSSVQLLQEADVVPDSGGYASWMPYQVQAEAKVVKESLPQTPAKMEFNPDAGKAGAPKAPLNKPK